MVEDKKKRKKDRKFEHLKKEFLKTVKYFKNKEEKIQVKIDSIMLSFDNHYTNLISSLLDKVSIKKYVGKINIDTHYNPFNKTSVEIYGVYSTYIRIQNEALNEKVINNIIRRILKKLIIKEIEKQFGYILNMYLFYLEVLNEFNVKKYYYYYYYKNSILKKYKDVSDEELLELLDKLFKDSNDFLEYFRTYSQRVKYKIIDFIGLTKLYINFFKEFRKKKYIGRDGQEKEKTEIQLIGLRGLSLDNLPEIPEELLIEREKILKRNYELLTGEKYNKNKMSIISFYIKKIKVLTDKNGRKVIDINQSLVDFKKSIKRNIGNLFFIDNFNDEFFMTNLYMIYAYFIKKNKGENIEIEHYTKVLYLNPIKEYILDKHKKNGYYIFSIKDFVLINDKILEKVLENYTDIETDKELTTSFEKYVLEYITKISINQNKDIDNLLNYLETGSEWWYDRDYGILSINKNFKKNLFTFLNQFIDTSDYKLNLSLNIIL